MNSKSNLGKIGEQIAVKYLINNGYYIIKRNFRTKFGEIDIIARDGKYLVFVEVKTRKGIKLGYPREAVDCFKQIKLKKLASLYLAQKKILSSYVRFDVIEVLLDAEQKVKSICLIKNAFE
ncbi:putative endonuclease [Caloramator fervidus]|uniref:UPF0102 protein SAMN05660865_01718 n=1 Tax=Caloramator fervidus TaxID=29344 RepID=A0A1H5XD29_9CLOT|nr:YraN family protein [Caloramator fervidus]SEG09116.1 putative endonuclease [Caloramator fervidus]